MRPTGGRLTPDSVPANVIYSTVLDTSLVMATMKMRRRVGNGVDVRGSVRNRVQMIAMLLVINVRLCVRHVVGVRLRMQVRLLIRWAVRLIRLSVSLANAVSVNHSSLLRIRLSLDILLLRVLLLVLALNHGPGRLIALLIRLRRGWVIAVRRHMIDVRGRVRDAVNVGCCVRHRVNVIAMLDVIGVRRRVWHMVNVRGRVGNAPLGLCGGRDSQNGEC